MIAQLFRRVAGRLLGMPPAATAIRLDKNLRVPMRDGSILLGNLYRSRTGGERATVLMRSPYGRGPLIGLRRAARQQQKGTEHVVER